MVTDFGIAVAPGTSSGDRLTATGLMVGTPQYMSPEQASGDRVIDGRSDLYSLGLIGYRMLTGRLPFEGVSTRDAFALVLSFRPTPMRNNTSAAMPEDSPR